MNDRTLCVASCSWVAGAARGAPQVTPAATDAKRANHGAFHRRRRARRSAEENSTQRDTESECRHECTTFWRVVELGTAGAGGGARKDVIAVENEGDSNQ